MILGEPIVLFRTEAGEPVAFEDRCAHRHLPLSMGKLVGDDAAMPLSRPALFGTDGRCVRIPGQEHIPQGAKVRTYPVVERYHWVWIWMGDPALADPATITDFHWLDDPNWGAKSSYLHVEANWQLVVDNLLDLTHLAFVHDTTIGNLALAEHAKVQGHACAEQRRRHALDHRSGAAADVSEGRRASPATSTAGRSSISCRRPSCGSTSAPPRPAPARREGRRVGGIGMRNLNAITPETETTSHYFWGQAHDFDVKNAETTNKIFEQIRTAFLEDVAVFSAQQRNLESSSHNPPQVDIDADAGVHRRPPHPEPALR